MCPLRNFLTSADVAKALKVPKTNLFLWEEKGRIPKARRDPVSGYRVYTEEDIIKIKKVIEGGDMGGLTSWVKAGEVSSEAWKYIKSRFPGKYSKLKRDIKAWGIDKVKIEFAQGVRPVQISISL